MTPDQIDTTVSDPGRSPARRQLLRQAGLGAALLGAAGAGLTAGSPSAKATADIDVEILNFALNLEYLEAEFYLYATTGKGLSAADSGGSAAGPVIGGSEVPFTDFDMRQIANDIASDEFSHVKFLRAALGSAAVPRPKIDLKASFTTLARAAGIVGPTGTFDPFAGQMHFLLGAYIFEDVGVTAYHGAAALITSKAYLTAAAGILGTEAYHAGAIRLAILRTFNPQLIAQADKVSVLRAALSGAADDSGPMVAKGKTNLVPGDSNAITFARTTSQVLNIVYGSPAKKPGLFYPNGMNGAIR